jgi:hypothetical protein
LARVRTTRVAPSDVYDPRMRALVLVAVAACGRIGFGVHPGDGGATGDVLSGEDATRDGPGLGCAPTFDICDDFEAAVIDPLTWMFDPNVTLDTAFGRSGSQSVRVHTAAFGPNQNRYTSLFETATLATATTFWIRGWFWLSALPAAGNGMELITAERPGQGGDYVFVFADRSSIYTQFDNASRSTPTTAPVGSWFCVVFKVVRSTATTGSLEMSGDLGAQSLTDVRTDGAMPMTHLTLGVGFASTNTPSAQPELDLWIDDVIIHTAAVTCAD